MPRTFVVSGANRGIGYAVVRALASGADAEARRIVMLCRDAAQAERARAALQADSRATLSVLIGSLDSTAAITRCAELIERSGPELHVLVHNAGVWPARLVRNADGLEEAFVVNHLAPFLLNRLLERKLAQSGARVVHVSAGLHVRGKPDLLRTPRGDDFSALNTYATTKLCNLALLPLFAERFRPLGVTVNALHPGVIRTGLGDRADLLGHVLRLVKKLWQAPEAAAPHVLRLALDPALAGVTGRYYHLDVEQTPGAAARDPQLAAALWSQAEQLTGLSERAANGEQAAG